MSEIIHNTQSMSVGQQMSEEYTTLRVKVKTKERLNKARHELYMDSFDDAINALVDLHEQERAKGKA